MIVKLSVANIYNRLQIDRRKLRPGRVDTNYIGSCVAVVEKSLKKLLDCG